MLLTIFTPTYNRKHTLERLYNSLKRQTYKDFEWIIVDDGSTDGTDDVVDGFILEKQISIKYISQYNSGKHVAHNKALDFTEGKYFFCIDSDDWINDEFLSVLHDECKENNPYGFIAYKADANNTLLSQLFPEHIRECTLFELTNTYSCYGEFSIIIRSDIAKKYKFPVFANEKFIGENVIYDRISQNYKFRLLNNVATICEYQPDGLSNTLNSVMKKNPAGYCLYFMQRIDMQSNLKNRIITAGKYISFTFLAKSQKTNYTGKHKALVKFCYPIGILFLIYYKIIRKF